MLEMTEYAGGPFAGGVFDHRLVDTKVGY
jgi:hypothetical protein